jgi:hypothetical protein
MSARLRRLFPIDAPRTNGEVEMNVFRAVRERILADTDEAGPDSLIGITEAGKAALALAFCLAVAAALVGAFWISS